MNKSAIFIMIMLIVIFCCSKEKKKEPEQALPENALVTKLSDFERSSEIRTYDAENLRQYIDGAAEQFMRYGFEKLATAEYVRNDTTLAVDVYLFSSVHGAFLIYSKHSDTLSEYADLGTASFISHGELFFCRDKYFVYLNCFGRDIPEKTLQQIGLAIDSLLIQNDHTTESNTEY